MLSTHTPENGPEQKEVKQWIKSKLALSLKALQKRYVTTDAVVTSEDEDANLLCCALEAVFVHGLKSKYIRVDAGGRGRKAGPRGPLPEPVFWTLLKTVTHRDVITELERLSFISTDVGRCRAWVRLALNDGLVECYLASLLREGSKLAGYYQPWALLLDPEEREVLLSYLQGLASLSFQLSYKSAVLNEWTVTPLALAGLCPAADPPGDLPPGAGRNGAPKRKESWDTVSQSSGGSDTIEVQRGGPGQGRGVCGKSGLTSSNLSLDTTGSSQLSSSLSSDSLLQGNGHKSPDKEPWPCDLDVGPGTEDPKKGLRDVLIDFGESTQSSQDSMHDDSYVSSLAPDHLSETPASSGSDGEAPCPLTLLTDAPATQPCDPAPLAPASEPCDPASQLCDPIRLSPATKPCDPAPLASASEPCDPAPLSPASEPCDPAPLAPASEPCDPASEPYNPTTPAPVKEMRKPAERPVSLHLPRAEARSPSPLQATLCPVEPTRPQQSGSVLGRRTSADSLPSPTTGLPKSSSWISEDDIYKPRIVETSEPEEALCLNAALVNGTASPITEPESPQSPPSVVHRRQVGLSNPFRGLLKLGHLERRGAVGMWREYYCELSPFEFRLYLNAEERTCCDNCFLLRCEDIRPAAPDGRFELAFPGKRLYLRAPSRDEAEDWVDRVIEAVAKCRPVARDDQWEVLQPSEGGEAAPPPLPPASSSAPSSPEHGSLEPAEQAQLDWTRPSEPEADAIKEAVLYLSQDEHSWTPLVFSLSLEALRAFRVQDGRKALRHAYPIESIRDVVPDASLGSPAFFKVLMSRDTLKLRAQDEGEARTWRSLIRGALNSYLDSCEDGGAEAGGAQGGNINRLVQHSLKGDGVLLPHLCTLPTEKGLDSQNFKCAGCPRQIGFSFGKARLCEFSGLFYCDACHQGNTIVIPSRMVHNWDLVPREVSLPALKLLSQVAREPLLNVESLNPGLCEHAEPMATVHELRQRLRLLGDYVLACRSGIRKKIQDKLDQRNYLLESYNLYSVTDLREIADGQHESFLGNLIQFASNHVYHCDLCTQRGFICQICNADNIIFPFEFQTTSRCRVCKSVFHSACKELSPSCPRCLRLQKYLERELQD
ncbi:pleckstrin homology domain-containing family M member 1 [Anguilla anguilla]|uniref:pleckstrin homology domain-containing family M member 1 n=1 Tax=Anguilla anguilla TaxID=7936 RepID=UPI0015A87B45|nr:pleckstrin homology domain-containing family M member 1 [Anguilla anguilla]XP_035261293.1 pleckstrin homology domain-containing family M member 1 [Anguilla anguilla]